MKKSKLGKIAVLLAAGALLFAGAFMSCSTGADSDDGDSTESDGNSTGGGTDVELSTHLVDLTATDVSWNSESNGVTNTVSTEAYLVFNHKVDIENDSISLKAKVNFSSLSEHVGIGFISVKGTSRAGYQLLTAQNIKNVGCTNGDSGQGFDTTATGFKFAKDTDYIFNVSISNGKISYIVYDSDGTTELAAKKETTIYHSSSDIVYPAFGGTTANAAAFSDITVEINGSKSAIDGVDPQSALPTLSLDKNILRIKTSETGTVSATATYNGETADITASSSDSSAVTVSVSGSEITVTPIKATPGVTVTVANAAADYITAEFTVVVADYPESNPSLTNVYPKVKAENAYTDGNLRLTFDSVPELNTSSFVAIFDSDGNIADTIMMSDEKQITNAGNSVYVGSQLVRVDGNDVLITPHFGALENEKTYYVAIPEGAITGKIGGSDFGGLSDAKDAENAWSFTTRSVHAAASEITVSSNESDSPDFRTVYGALNAIGTSGTGSYTIKVSAGEYYELVNAKIAADVKIVGPDTAELDGTDSEKNAVIKYINHNEWNGGTATRPSFYIGGTGNLVLENVTIWNATRRGTDTTAQEAQAEAIYFQSTGNLAAYNSTFKSYQDTVQIGNKGGKAWFYKCYIEGDVDFLWGTADVALFEECTLKALNDSARTTKTEDLLVARTYSKGSKIGKGFVVFNSEIEIEDGITLSFGRCAGIGADFYDQCAVVNTKVSGTLSEAWWTSKNYTPLSGYEKYVGWKDYNIKDSDGKSISPTSRCEKTYEIEKDVYSLEFNGRYAILNRVFDTSANAYSSAASTWKVSELEKEFSASEDSSADNEYEDSESEESVTVTFDLSSSDVNIQNKIANLYGAISDSSEYSVRAVVNATVSSGKLQGNGSQHAQMNKGTIISVPVTQGAVVTVTASSAGAKYALYTIAGTAASTTELSSSYTHSDAGGAYINIVSTGTAYPAKIQISGLDLENLPSAVSLDYSWNEADIVSKEVKIEKAAAYYDELYIDASSGKFAANNTSWTACNSGTIIYIPMSGAGTVSFTACGSYTITGGESTDLSTSGTEKPVSYSVSEDDLVSLPTDDGVKYAKITFGASSQYIKGLARTY